jgi:Spy/CpxP family protein refolding chaperone
MDIFLKSRFAAWMFGLLIVLNIASLLTIWSLQLKKPLHNEPPPNESAENVQRFLNRELELTNDQKQRFRDARAQYLEESRRKLEDIHLLKIDLLREAFSSSLDSLNARELARVIGDKQEKFELLTYYQFRDLYYICKPEQQEKFISLLEEIVKISRPDEGSGEKRNPPTPRQRPPKR